MLAINLLSPDKRRESTMRSILLHCKIFLEIALICTALIAIVTVITKLFLLDTFIATASAPTANIHSRELEIKIRNVNTATALLDRLHTDTIPWSALLIRLTESIPNGITINEMILQKKGASQFVLKGKAATRQDLLVLKTALEKLPFLRELSFPIANLLTPKDIIWQLEAKLDLRSL